MATITNRELVNVFQSLEQLARRQLPVKISYAIAKTLRSVREEVRLFGEERDKIVPADKRNPDGSFVMETLTEETQARVRELFALSVEVEAHEVELEGLDDAAPNELAALLAVGVIK